MGRNRKLAVAVTLALIVAGSFVLNCWGLRWGLPSEERLQLAFGDHENLAQMLPDLSSDVEEPGLRATYEQSERISRNSVYYDQIRTYHSDEGDFLKAIANLDPLKGDFDPDGYKYPSFHVYVVAGFIGLGAAEGWIPLKTDVSYYIQHPDDMAKLYLVGRAVAAVMGTLTVLLVFLIGKELFSERAGLLAAGALAVLPIWALHSHFAKVDVPQVFWSMLALLCCAKLVNTGRMRWYWLSCAACGLSFASKYPGVASYVFIVASLFYALRSRGKPLWKAIIGYSCLAVPVIIAVFFVASPYVILNFKAASAQLADMARLQYGQPAGNPLALVLRNWPNYVGFIKALVTTMGWPLAVLAALGIVASLVRRRPGEVLILVFTFAYFAAYGLSYLPHPNFMLNIIPPLALLIGALVASLCRRSVLGYVVAGVVVCAFVYTTLFTLAYDVYMSKVDVRREASLWINENLAASDASPQRTVVGVSQYPVIYRMPAFSADKFEPKELTPDTPVNEYPAFVIFANVGQRVPSKVLKFVRNNYAVRRVFDTPVKLWGISFPAFSETIRSGLGHIDPVFTIYEKQTLLAY